MGCGLGAGMLGIDRVLSAVNDVVVDAIFDVRRSVLHSEQSAGIGFVLGEEQLRRAFTMKPAIAVIWVIQLDRDDVRPDVPRCSPGRCSRPPHDHVLRNQTVGSRRSWPLRAHGSRP